MATRPLVMSLQCMLLYVCIGSPSFHTTDVPNVSTSHKTASKVKTLFLNKYSHNLMYMCSLVNTVIYADHIVTIHLCVQVKND